MKKQEQAVGAGAATTRAGECHFSGSARVQAVSTLEAALPQSVRKASGFPIAGSRDSRLSLEAA